MVERKVFQGAVGVSVNNTRQLVILKTADRQWDDTGFCVAMTPDEALDIAERLIRSAREADIARGRAARRRLAAIAEELKANMVGSALRVDNAIDLMEAVQATAALLPSIEEAAITHVLRED